MSKQRVLTATFVLHHNTHAVSYNSIPPWYMTHLMRARVASESYRSVDELALFKPAVPTCHVSLLIAAERSCTPHNEMSCSHDFGTTTANS